MNLEPDEIIDKIKAYKNKLAAMDDRVKKYLSDRKTYRHPGHEALIDEIHRFENQIHALRNGDVHFWLEGLLHSLIVHQRIWRVAFEKDGTAYSEKGGRGTAENDIPIDRLYSAASKKWDQMGVDKKITKKELLKKIRPEYEKAKKNLKDNEKISWSLNRKTHQIQIKVDREK